MSLVMRVSDHVVAFDFGRVIAVGTPEEVRANPEVVRACLGTAA
jgi:branched-chain amino acid transport system ATP-binding protein